MRGYSRKARQLRLQLEALRPPVGVGRWILKLKNFRVAGVPRSVSISERVEILTAMVLDEELLPQARVAAFISRCECMKYPAYDERVKLNQELLQRYLKDFRENDYERPYGVTWEEDQSKCSTELILTPEEQEREARVVLKMRELLEVLQPECTKQMKPSAEDHKAAD